MKAVIVEDEFVAAQNLERLIASLKKDIQVIAVLQSVEESVEWFQENQHPDIVFMDIHLADGESFSIFEHTEITSPIIFTTAYDEYALKAFDVNSIDYLLKPISAKSLDKALTKLSTLTAHSDDSTPVHNNSDLVAQLMQTLNQPKEQYKKYFLIPHRDKLLPLPVENIAYILFEMKSATIVDYDNRKYIVAHRAIADLSVWFGGKLAVNLTIPTPERIIVSRAKNNDFKDWFSN